MTVTVTGATGHIGGHLVRALLDEGRTVRAAVFEDVRPLEGLRVERVHADVRDPASLRKAFEGSDVVYHMAARISIDPAEAGLLDEVNVRGVRNVVDACRETGVRRLVHFSSIHAFSPHPRDGVVDETRPPSGEGCPPYDRSKAAGEREVLEAVERGLDAVIVNPTGCLGPLDFKPSAMGQMLLDVYHRRLPALVDGGFNWVDVRDVARGALAAEKKGRRGERYLLGGTWMSVRDVTALVEEFTGHAPPRIVAPAWLAHLGVPFAVGYARLRRRRPLFTHIAIHMLENHRHVSSDKAKRELGFESRPVRNTVADAFAWFRDAGMLA